MRMFPHRQKEKTSEDNGQTSSVSEKNVASQKIGEEVLDSNTPDVEKPEDNVADKNDTEEKVTDTSTDTDTNVPTEGMNEAPGGDDVGDTIVFDDDNDDGVAVDDGDEQIFGGPINFDSDENDSASNVDNNNVELPDVNVGYSVDNIADDVISDETDDATPEQEVDNGETSDFVPREHYDRVCSELETLKRRHQILLSDWENYKTRTANEVERAKRVACSELAVDVLPVLDDIERAISHARANEQVEIADGLMSIYKKALGVYVKHGIERVYPKGEVFDIEKHMAVSRINVEEASVDEGMVEQVLQCGYIMGDVVLRPAMVTVAC